jgi:hypothetical protein
MLRAPRRADSPSIQAVKIELSKNGGWNGASFSRATARLLVATCILSALLQLGNQNSRSGGFGCDYHTLDDRPRSVVVGGGGTSTTTSAGGDRRLPRRRLVCPPMRLGAKQESIANAKDGFGTLISRQIADQIPVGNRRGGARGFSLFDCRFVRRLVFQPRCSVFRLPGVPDSDRHSELEVGIVRVQPLLTPKQAVTETRQWG